MREPTGDPSDAPADAPRKSSRRPILAVIAAVVVIDILAFILVPPPAGASGTGKYPTDGIAANLELVPPHVVIDLVRRRRAGAGCARLLRADDLVDDPHFLDRDGLHPRLRHRC